MSAAILVLNAGSSSLKISIFSAGLGESALVARGQVDGIGARPRFVLKDADGKAVEEYSWFEGAELDHDSALKFVLERVKDKFRGHRLAAVGHRVVHGGVQFAEPVLIDANVLVALEALAPLAPLHQPHNLAAIRAVAKQAPALPQVACFDTAFHRTQPAVAQMFGLPRRFIAEGVHRYGFHGLSYEYVAKQLPQFDPRLESGKVVVAHLGNGASMCAMLAGRSVATTMSFTPVDGLVMGTRTGALDPGVLLYLMSKHRMSAADLEKLIYHESGLLGVSGISSDMRELLGSNEPHATEAIDLFVYRISRELGSLAAALGGLDALVFTGGIGENSAHIRERVCREAAWLEIEFDSFSNEARKPRISTPRSRTSVWVVPTNEELMIAEHTRRVLTMNGVHT